MAGLREGLCGHPGHPLDLLFWFSDEKFSKSILLQNSLVCLSYCFTCTSVTTQTASSALVLSASVYSVSPRYQLKEPQAEIFLLLWSMRELQDHSEDTAILHFGFCLNLNFKMEGVCSRRFKGAHLCYIPKMQIHAGPRQIDFCPWCRDEWDTIFSCLWLGGCGIIVADCKLYPWL